MKSILIGLIFFPCVILAACEHKCQPTLEAYCPAKPVETPLVEYDGHLWKAIMLEHHPDCGCGEDLWIEWPKDDQCFLEE